MLPLCHFSQTWVEEGCVGSPPGNGTAERRPTPLTPYPLPFPQLGLCPQWRVACPVWAGVVTKVCRWQCGRVAQWLAQQFYTLLVGGSNPSSPTKSTVNELVNLRGTHDGEGLDSFPPRIGAGPQFGSQVELWVG